MPSCVGECETMCLSVLPMNPIYFTNWGNGYIQKSLRRLWNRLRLFCLWMLKIGKGPSTLKRLALGEVSNFASMLPDYLSFLPNTEKWT